MDLSAQAYQASINDLKKKISTQEESVKIWRDEILSLQTDHIELDLLLKQDDAGGYDRDALENNKGRIQENIEDFQDEIAKMEQKTSDYQRMIVTLEAKRDNAEF